MIFLFLTFDEGGQIHEKFTNVTRRLLGSTASGVLFYAWVIPYLIAAALVGTFLLRSFMRQAKLIKTRLLLSGSIYTLGVVGAEMLGGNEAQAQGTETVLYLCIATAEESLELCGLLLFIWTFLSALKSQREVYQMSLT